MSIVISRSQIEKLGHELHEIRVRTLKDIEGKLSRCLLVDQEVYFSASDLFKSLIRWFSFRPVCEEETVLNLMIILLNSQYGKDAIDFFSPERIEKEIRKIDKILTHSANIHLLREITDILETYKSKRKCESESKIDTDGTFSLPEFSMTTVRSGIDDIAGSDFVKCWGQPPNPVEMNSLMLLREALDTNCDTAGLKHTLKFVKFALRDYPTEYFLQPPYMFKSLIKLLSSPEKTIKKQALFLLDTLVRSLKKRHEYFRLTLTHRYENEPDSGQSDQIAIVRLGYDLIKVLVNLIKDITEKSSIDNLTQSLRLIADILKLLEVDGAYREYMWDVAIEIGHLIKYYRGFYSDMQNNDYLSRIHYVILVELLAKLKIILDTQREATVRSKSIGNGIFIDELKIAALDLALKHFYPRVHTTVLSSLSEEIGLDSSLFLITTQLKDYLKPAIEILRQPDILSDRELISRGCDALKTMYITRSICMANRLFEAVVNKSCEFDGNLQLREMGERLYLKLLSHEIIEIKKNIYRLSGERLGKFLNSVMDGESVVPKSCGDLTSCSLGIPLSVDILIEIICFGYNSDDAVIHTNAKNILIMLLRSKNIISEYWDQLFATLMPVLPLLQCHVKFNTKLGRAVLDIYDPSYDLDVMEMIKGNIRFLFSEDDEVRNEAITRCMYIVASHPTAEKFHPNISNILDTIPNDICFVPVPHDPSRDEIDGSLESIDPLLEILRSDDAQPSIRKSALLQLNLLAGNRKTNDQIHDNGGWLVALTCLENALTIDNNTEFIDAAIPCTGLVAKIALNVIKFRRILSSEPNLFFHLLRALFMFHHNPTLKVDATIALFLFMYSDYIFGVNKISVPVILSNIRVPIACDFIWRTSAHNTKTDIEMEYDDQKKNDGNELTAVKLQHFRIAFASVWFQGITGIVKNHKVICKDRNMKLEKSVVDYTRLPPQLLINCAKNSLEISNSLRFDESLNLKQSDMNLIRTTSFIENLKQYMKSIEHAKSVNDIVVPINCMETLLILPVRDDEQYSARIIKQLSRFYAVPPNNEMDFIIFKSVLKILVQFIRAGFDEILIKILQELMKTVSNFDLILTAGSKGETESKSNDGEQIVQSVFIENCTFLSVVFKIALKSKNEKIMEIIRSTNGTIKLFQKYFNLISEILYERDTDRTDDFARLHALITLYRIITSSGLLEIDRSQSRQMVNRLLHFMASTKLYAQTGADFNKNCLFSIGNIIQEAEIKPKYVKLLSGLCSHSDFEIRSCAWGVLNKIGKILEGAELIINELSYLPGGIHACCLSTVLDKFEVSLVRSVAADLFANLIAHVDNTNKQLIQKVTPRYNIVDGVDNNLAVDVIKTIEMILSRQQFFENARESLKYFIAEDFVAIDTVTRITSCDVISGYCVIISNLIEMNEAFLSDQKVVALIYEIAILLCYVPSAFTLSALKMVNEISSLLTRCFQKKKYPDLLDRISTHDHAIMGSLGVLLKRDNFENLSVEQQTTFLIAIVNVIRLLGNTRSGFEFFSRFWSEVNSIPLIELIADMVDITKWPALSLHAMDFISTFFMIAQSETFEFTTIVETLDAVKCDGEPANGDEISDDSSVIIVCDENESPNIPKVTMPAVNDGGKMGQKAQYGSEIIFNKLLNNFNVVCRKDKPCNGVVVWSREKRVCLRSIQVMLLCSQGARNMAKGQNLLEKIVERFEAIYDGLGMTITDFIRRHGDSKKDPILKELSSLSEIITSWFCSNEILNDDKQITNLFKIFLLLWPWTQSSSDLQIQFIISLKYLSERSVPVCRGISKCFPPLPESLLQKITHKMIEETSRAKNPHANTVVLSHGLRVMSNCCSCIEGRMFFNKINVLDILNQLHPNVIKQQKGWSTITLLWLQFWEIWSSYPEGSAIRHIAFLGSHIAKSGPDIRRQCLMIMRNMCFQSVNRSGMLSSPDVLYTFDSILESNSDICINKEQEYDQFIIVSAIWKLVVNSSKGKHTIKNSGIPQKMKNLQKRLVLASGSDGDSLEENEFYRCLQIVLGILD